MESNNTFFSKECKQSNFITRTNELENFSSFKDITFSLIQTVSTFDKTFINRLDEENNAITNEAFENLTDSIREVGLLNPIYLLETDKNNHIIISGWRRFHALKEIYKNDKNKIFSQKAIILKKETPFKILETISINENTKRKDLTLLELSYKFNKLSKTKGTSIEECLKQFNIGKTQFHAIKKAMDFFPIIKENLLETVGPVKANLLNKILEKLLIIHPESKANSLIFEYSKNRKEDLKTILKELTEDTIQKNNILEIKKNTNMTIFKIKENLTEEDHMKIEIFFKNLLKK
ncbi:ParB/RepB/Spo0J family partition protein [Candidatus Cetobacterium colombiensis]|uniref:ParB N-terminal domain-containing protein n=1 Tax=Candidatus Cetobacterium colombiensis TaxID=3073100 RepID=A0ABU4WFG6_9FUSO|nr:ParB N-terminal domain-containing protein [Candidatus Cetobacterium colombiensis]MDX8337449.1 ParB N-terminal domain-containing protein [Candidatus Cetobacterium colombiensis]